ncbi:MAG TPA: NAD-dependent epimerase/dehydratase family protein [Firmicutes bacterium]|jgi:UDP-glucose 4-epimerase|nr:NAD-dependent epimerase/dehydratase family protein [Bacillota bacterium]
MRVLVTGGAGFIGSHLTQALLANGHEVAVVDNLSSGRVERVPAGVWFRRIDIAQEALDQLFADFSPQIIFHLAAQVDVAVSVQDPVRDAYTNILGSLNVLRCCEKYRAQRLIYSSSAAVYGEPVQLPVDEDHACRPRSPYGVSKYCFEVYLAASTLPHIILRYANVYGPGQELSRETGVITTFVRRAAAGQRLLVHGDGSQRRDFVYVADVVAANLRAMQVTENAVLNICTGVSTSLHEVLNILRDLVPEGIAVEYGPPRLGDIKDSVLCRKRAAAWLGWYPQVDLAQGLATTFAHIAARGS